MGQFDIHEELLRERMALSKERDYAFIRNDADRERIDILRSAIQSALEPIKGITLPRQQRMEVILRRALQETETKNEQS